LDLIKAQKLEEKAEFIAKKLETLKKLKETTANIRLELNRLTDDVISRVETLDQNADRVSAECEQIDSKLEADKQALITEIVKNEANSESSIQKLEDFKELNSQKLDAKFSDKYELAFTLEDINEKTDSPYADELFTTFIKREIADLKKKIFVDKVQTNTNF
jgi:hypothetical protein